MKVLIVVHHFPPHLSGVGNVAAEQAKHLAQNGNDVLVLTSDCSDKAGISNKDSYELHRLKALNFMESRFSAPFPIFSPSLVWQMYRLVKSVDVVHVHDAFYLSSFVAAVWAKLLRKPLFITQHIAMIPHPNKFVEAIERLVYTTSGAFIFSYSKKVFVINERVKSFLVSHGVTPDKIVTITNGVDFDLFHPATAREKVELRNKYNLPANKPLALFVGRYVPKKGYNKLLKAGDKKYSLVFVGGKHSTHHQAKDKIFLGILPQHQTAEVYRACDVLILPSEGEGFPLSIQEAMASGLPVIAGADHGYDSYAFDKSLFRLINPTVKEIKNHLIQIVEDNSLRQSMGKYSLRYAKKRFKWHAVTKQMEGFYLEALT